MIDRRERLKNRLLTLLLALLSLAWVYPVVMIFLNSLKKETAITTAGAFQLPETQSFSGLAHYRSVLLERGFARAFGCSLLITVTSLALILLCCSMCAWFITRVRAWWARGLYYLFVFSMVVPFQMVMFTLSAAANRLGLDTPWTICVIYLGFGAGLAVFLFCGFMRSIPVEVEEAAMIDGCSPIQTFFLVVLPILKPTLVSVGILETMWLWNDYLLPYLVLDRTRGFQTIPMLIQSFQQGFGRVEMGPTMAGIILNVIPIVIVYLIGQKHIIKGVAAGAVKG